MTLSKMFQHLKRLTFLHINCVPVPLAATLCLIFILNAGCWKKTRSESNAQTKPPIQSTESDNSTDKSSPSDQIQSSRSFTQANRRVRRLIDQLYALQLEARSAEKHGFLTCVERYMDNQRGLRTEQFSEMAAYLDFETPNLIDNQDNEKPPLPEELRKVGLVIHHAMNPETKIAEELGAIKSTTTWTDLYDDLIKESPFDSSESILDQSRDARFASFEDARSGYLNALGKWAIIKSRENDGLKEDVLYSLSSSLVAHFEQISVDFEAELLESVVTSYIEDLNTNDEHKTDLNTRSINPFIATLIDQEFDQVKKNNTEDAVNLQQVLDSCMRKISQRYSILKGCQNSVLFKQTGQVEKGLAQFVANDDFQQLLRTDCVINATFTSPDVVQEATDWSKSVRKNGGAAVVEQWLELSEQQDRYESAIMKTFQVQLGNDEQYSASIFFPKSLNPIEKAGTADFELRDELIGFITVSTESSRFPYTQLRGRVKLCDLPPNDCDTNTMQPIQGEKVHVIDDSESAKTTLSEKMRTYKVAVSKLPESDQFRDDIETFISSLPIASIFAFECGPARSQDDGLTVPVKLNLKVSENLKLSNNKIQFEISTDARSQFELSELLLPGSNDAPTHVIASSKELSGLKVPLQSFLIKAANRFLETIKPFDWGNFRIVQGQVFLLEDNKPALSFETESTSIGIHRFLIDFHFTEDGQWRLAEHSAKEIEDLLKDCMLQTFFAQKATKQLTKYIDASAGSDLTLQIEPKGNGQFVKIDIAKGKCEPNAKVVFRGKMGGQFFPSTELATFDKDWRINLSIESVVNALADAFIPLWNVNFEVEIHGKNFLVCITNKFSDSSTITLVISESLPENLDSPNLISEFPSDGTVISGLRLNTSTFFDGSHNLCSLENLDWSEAKIEHGSKELLDLIIQGLGISSLVKINNASVSDENDGQINFSATITHPFNGEKTECAANFKLNDGFMAVSQTFLNAVLNELKGKLFEVNGVRLELNQINVAINESTDFIDRFRVIVGVKASIDYSGRPIEVTVVATYSKGKIKFDFSGIKDELIKLVSNRVKQELNTILQQVGPIPIRLIDSDPNSKKLTFEVVAKSKTITVKSEFSFENGKLFPPKTWEITYGGEVLISPVVLYDIGGSFDLKEMPEKYKASFFTSVTAAKKEIGELVRLTGEVTLDYETAEPKKIVITHDASLVLFGSFEQLNAKGKLCAEDISQNPVLSGEQTISTKHPLSDFIDLDGEMVFRLSEEGLTSNGNINTTIFGFAKQDSSYCLEATKKNQKIELTTNLDLIVFNGNATTMINAHEAYTKAEGKLGGATINILLSTREPSYVTASFCGHKLKIDINDPRNAPQELANAKKEIEAWIRELLKLELNLPVSVKPDSFRPGKPSNKHSVKNKGNGGSNKNPNRSPTGQGQTDSNQDAPMDAASKSKLGSMPLKAAAMDENPGSIKWRVHKRIMGAGNPVFLWHPEEGRFKNEFVYVGQIVDWCTRDGWVSKPESEILYVTPILNNNNLSGILITLKLGENKTRDFKVELSAVSNNKLLKAIEIEGNGKPCQCESRSGNGNASGSQLHHSDSFAIRNGSLIYTHTDWKEKKVTKPSHATYHIPSFLKIKSGKHGNETEFKWFPVDDRDLPKIRASKPSDSSVTIEFNPDEENIKHGWKWKLDDKKVPVLINHPIAKKLQFANDKQFRDANLLHQADENTNKNFLVTSEMADNGKLTVYLKHNGARYFGIWDQPTSSGGVVYSIQKIKTSEQDEDAGYKVYFEPKTPYRTEADVVRVKPVENQP